MNPLIGQSMTFGVGQGRLPGFRSGKQSDQTGMLGCASIKHVVKGIEGTAERVACQVRVLAIA